MIYLVSLVKYENIFPMTTKVYDWLKRKNVAAVSIYLGTGLFSGRIGPLHDVR